MDVDEEFTRFEWRKRTHDGGEGLQRVEVNKKRHIHQLFVRGDNIVLVGEAGS